mmetsp:Transcript_20187/g.30012  ORF Transcript_20187/g.30012 Transcript_20187/m.30012 type:complete len:219 (-) Transcript_20187:43-699(-)
MPEWSYDELSDDAEVISDDLWFHRVVKGMPYQVVAKDFAKYLIESNFLSVLTLYEYMLFEKGKIFIQWPPVLSGQHYLQQNVRRVRRAGLRHRDIIAQRVRTVCAPAFHLLEESGDYQPFHDCVIKQVEHYQKQLARDTAIECAGAHRRFQHCAQLFKSAPEIQCSHDLLRFLSCQWTCLDSDHNGQRQDDIVHQEIPLVWDGVSKAAMQYAAQFFSK